MRSAIVSLILCAALAALGQQAPTPRKSSPFTEPPAYRQDKLVFEEPLGEFHAADLSGNEWDVGRLRNRITVVDIWAVWCIPCRAQHAEIQRFHEKTKGSPVLQVLTFSVDKDPSDVQKYMKEHGYSFPVIVSGELPRKLFPGQRGIPQFWVIGQDGRKSAPLESWSMGRVLYEVERLAEGEGRTP